MVEQITHEVAHGGLADTDRLADLLSGHRSVVVDGCQRSIEDELRLWADRYNKPIVITEFGADAVAGLHSLPAQMWSEEFQQQLISTYLDVFVRVEHVVGEHVWNFTDFATMQGSNRVIGNRKGVFTREREPKAVAYLLRERWCVKPETP